ncbi:hypothetical protein [Fimbriimonas ginsengisoli]|uniref:Uncharacterized protein n=1 Tax=Fimbriimonas ginsengisoli Gsoil 348 TaxID=661478 RepID=A0A068NSL5_FIMGI|nr:hypothetical protein [Fimbriimonas ginsengisoli]AIE84574.1 hypothetical protein OP10G_1206 [Fimbriimonas ginsengisoli Gsoil 348]
MCLSLLNSSVRGLTQQGPSQDRYVSELQLGLNKDFIPRLQQVASRTMSEMQPVVQKEFENLNTRVPELTQASMKEVDQLQKSLPERGEKVLDETFGAALRAQEPKIREMFPSVKEEQVKALMTSLSDMATVRGSRVADELLLPHTNRMRRIVEGLRKIEATEKPPAPGEVADWHMGLLVLDLMREDLKEFEPKKSDVKASAADKSKQLETKR